MNVKTTKIINDIEYDYTYSDAGMIIERNGARYSEALDPLNSGREYIETDERIEPTESANEATAEDYESALSEFGVEV